MTNEILKVSRISEPLYNHQQPTAHALNVFSEFLYSMGMKLRVNGTESQKERFKQLSTAYDEIRQCVTQQFILEHKNAQLEYRLAEQVKQNAELKKTVEKLEQVIAFT
jgi:hypothetical protein